MLIENEFHVAESVEDVWRYMLDVPRMAGCMPGASLTATHGDTSFEGQLETKMGPVSLTFGGKAEIVERDEAGKRLVAHATGAEQKGKGQASLTMTVNMQSAGGGTRVHVSQDLTLTGAAAQYGRGMIEDVSTLLMRQFADCVQQDIALAKRGQAQVATAAPVRGVSVGLAALLMPLKRFLRRLFIGGGTRPPRQKEPPARV